jgi:alkylhydroperoxidase family enzyme
MMVPLPNCFSIWASAACSALAFSALAAAFCADVAAVGLTAMSMIFSFLNQLLTKFSQIIYQHHCLVCWMLEQ